MQPPLDRHGCHFALRFAVLAALICAPAAGAPPARVRSKLFDIEYRVSKASLPLSSVRLWFTLDGGKTWQLYGSDEDAQPPMRFAASHEGLHGFHLVVTNSAGASGAEPSSGTRPQFSIFVDYTSPVVQLHKPGGKVQAGGVLPLRWSAVDGFLTSRPVTLAYKLVPDGEWHTIATSLSNTGRYDWELPEDLRGRILVRITVVDRGGNRSEAATAIEISAAVKPPGPTPADPADGITQAPVAAEELTAAMRIADRPDAERVRRLYQMAQWHRGRGERHLAIARLRDALKLDPNQSLALAEMGSLLYDAGDYAESLTALRLALAQQPELKSGLKGAARTCVALHDYESAAGYLEQVLKNHPDDAGAWLNLGDVAIYRGDEVAARECFGEAASVDPEAAETIEQAKMRLANLSWLGDQYRAREHDR